MYQEHVQGKTIEGATGFGSFVELSAGNIKILYNEGANLRFIEERNRIPKKHQLLFEFTYNTFLCASIQMYGGVGCFIDNELDNEYYKMAKEKPSPLTKEFDEKYFNDLLSDETVQKLNVKAFLATEQRIPGLGNGVLQDILYNAKLHPKVKVRSVSETQKSSLFTAMKTTLSDMVKGGGRDTEKDLFGQQGGYITKMSKNTVGSSCTLCGSSIKKASYMGGSIYFCEGCQSV
jgi:formamidopyrimidine-DNA glycosylase